MTDIGWFSDARRRARRGATRACTRTSRPTVVIGACDSRGPERGPGDGCSVSDLAQRCDAENPGTLRYLGCMNRLGRDLKEDGVITARQRLALQLCAVRSRRP